MRESWEPPREVEEYRVTRLLGRGAMGEVWLAHDTLLDRPVAMKFIVGDHDARGRFFSEARAIARLDHPNVIRIHRVGEIDGRPFLVSEYLRGDSLDRLPRPLPIDEALAIALGLARGLAAAHRRGVLHRDVKPANAFRTEEREIKLLDFGLAKVIDSETLDLGATLDPTTSADATPTNPTRTSPARPSTDALDVTLPGSDTSGAPRPSAPALDATLPGDSSAGDSVRQASGGKGASIRTPRSLPTLAGSVMGTPAYLAPELWDGREATAATDVYALGATLYELLGGAPPHVASSMTELATLARTRDVTPLQTVRPEIPAALATLVERCLQRDPARRYESAEAVCSDLEAIAHTGSTSEQLEGNPYRGLAAFDEHHARLFFGRDRDVAEMLDRLRSEPWLVVAGRSGAGKSSVVRAGLVPRIREHALDERDRADWRVIVMVPGERPLTALAAAAAAALHRDERALVKALEDEPGRLALELRADREHRTLLVIDQLEELATLSEPAERDRFVDALVPAMVLTPNLRVVATIRSDFVGQLDAMPALARAVGRALYLLGPMDREGLRAAITAPAAVHGFRFETAADVDHLVESAPSHGGLPLLEFALANAWELRDRDKQVIPSRALDEIGGVEGALAKHADDVLAVLSTAARTAARRVLLRLVSADRTRARRIASELAASDDTVEARAATTAALDALVKGRLVAVGDGDEGRTYELAHEALITHWSRLRVWLDEADLDHATRERIELAAKDWERQGRPADGLWRGRQIAAVAALPLAELSMRGREFVELARRASRRSQRIRRGLAIGAFAALASWGAIALWLNDRANTARGRAEASAVAAEASALAARARTAALYEEQGRQALVANDPMRAVAYLDAAHGAGQRGGGLAFLVDRASGMLDGDVARLVGHDDGVHDVAWSPDGTRLATTSIDRTARIWRADGTAIATLRGHTDEVLQVRWSPDGTRVATASLDGTAAIWNATSGERMVKLEGHKNRVLTVAWTSDGKRVVTGSMDRTAKVWDATTGAALGTLAGHADWLSFAHVSPRGDRILTGSADRTAVLWDASTFQPVAKLVGHGAVVWRGAFSADGRRVATGSDDDTVRVWDVASGALVATFTGHTRNITHVTFSPDGELGGSTSEDGTAQIWRAATGELVATLGHGVPVWDLSFSPDGARVSTSSNDGTAVLWSAHEGTRLWTFVGHTDAVGTSVFSPDGSRLATASGDRSARVWDARRTNVVVAFEGQQGAMWDARFSPTGDRVVTTADDRTVRVWNAAGSVVVAWDEDRTTERKLQPRFVRFAPDGTWFVTMRGTTVERRDARTAKLLHAYTTTTLSRLAAPSRDGKQLAIADGNDVRLVGLDRDGGPTFRGHTAPVITIDWSPDGQTVLTASEDKTARLWSVDGKELARFDHRAPVVVAWFSPDGKRFVTTAEDRTVALWSVDSRKIVATFDEQTAGAVDAAWSPDGELVATGGIDGVVRIWSAVTGRLLSVVGQHREAVTAVSFHPDGRQLLSSSRDGTARIWSLARREHDITHVLTRARCRVPYHVQDGLLARGAPCVQ